MRIKPKQQHVHSKKKAASAAKAGTAKPHHPGLTPFSLDASEAFGKTAFSKLAKSAHPPKGVKGIRAAAIPKINTLDPESAARQYLEKALASEEISEFNRPQIQSGDSEFKSLGSESVPLTATTVVKFRQMFNKIPVYGSLVSVELDEKNNCLSINSSVGTPEGVGHVAKVSPAQALQAVAKTAGVKANAITKTPLLHYFFDLHRDKWYLVYIIEDVATRAPKSSEAVLKDYIVDAQSGRLISELPRTATMAAQRVSVRDVNNKLRRIVVEKDKGQRLLRDSMLNVHTYSFDFKDPTAQYQQLPGGMCGNPPAPWPVEAVTAHANGCEAARFLRKVLLRQNIDNRGGAIISSINCWDRSDGTSPAREWKNAYWNGSQMVYGQIKWPDGSFYPVAAMLDIVGHELFHGVTDCTARLEYRAQSGALNESYSDIFGVIMANFGKSLDRWNWDIGTGFDGPGTVLRNMANPALHGQPMHMKDFLTTKPPYNEDNDYGWVHDNAGIHNYAAYRIMTAKRGRKFLFTKEELAAIFYLALTQHLSRASHFDDSRRAVLQATRSFCRGNRPVVLAAKLQAVEKGFSAAGIEMETQAPSPARRRTGRRRR